MTVAFHGIVRTPPSGAVALNAGRVILLDGASVMEEATRVEGPTRHSDAAHLSGDRIIPLIAAFLVADLRPEGVD